MSAPATSAFEVDSAPQLPDPPLSAPGPSSQRDVPADSTDRIDEEALKKSTLPNPYAPFTFQRRLRPPSPATTTEPVEAVAVDVQELPDEVAAEGEGEPVPTFPPKLKTRYFLKSSTDVGNGEASASLQGHVVHFLGGLESLQGSASVGSRTRRAIDLNFTTPIRWNPNRVFSAGIFSFERDNSAYSSVREAVWGGRASLMVVDQMGDQHEFVYEAACRNIGRLAPSASLAMRQQARTTSKSSLAYNYTRDSRDSPLEPEYCTKGSLLRTMLEVAGPGGDAKFVKLGAELTTSRAVRWSNQIFPLGEGWSTTLTARGGLLRTLTGQSSHFPDRVQLGGPTSVRMFAHNGLGPKSNGAGGRSANGNWGDSLGGDAHWSVGWELGGPIWGRPQLPLKWHIFGNAGQLALLNQTSTQSAIESMKRLTQPSISAGAGLVFRQGPLRLEVNLGVPLVAHRTDNIRRGFQVGIGIDFL
ncbi:hypothetical protein OC846_002697 [Tilletia horrida]|uniref:Bacterial surface antigen (D15) domain-containing protein n=1 Tax=Tilletia horrida TaxID=155126 RepID=A0AAN6GWJ3_9BASI|nr:hypothetical protein OC846_002697 [Tilletia horrida]KAK0566262.1 hypothetical protein OC861_003341 [Tilletia horrida]